MKIHIVYISIIAALVIALGWTCTVFDERREGWDIARTALEKDVNTARETAERWRVTATALQGQTHAQNALAEACLQREAAALSDASERETIMLLGPSVNIPKPSEHASTGVSDATRRAAADYINRGL